MTIEDVPRTLVYKDFETVADILGSGSERTLEQEFYDRLIKRPFIESLDYPPKWICTIFNNARYIYYLVKTEDDDPSLCFNFYLAKAAEGAEKADTRSHIVAATMALVYSWLKQKLHENREYIPELNKEIFIHFDERKEKNVIKLCEKINLHFSKEEKEVTTEIIKVFDDLTMEKSDLPSNIDTLFDDIFGIEEAAFNAPIQDIARGIEYLMECYDPENGTNGERYLFLKKILNRFENEKAPINDSEATEKAKIIINRSLQQLEYATEPKPSSLGLSSDYTTEVPDQEESDIGWIIVKEKAPIIIETIMNYMEGKTAPKDIMMPVRAAIDAGVIRKPTPAEFKKTFGANRIKSKSSIDSYSKLDLTPYVGEIYNNMVEMFRQILAE